MRGIRALVVFSAACLAAATAFGATIDMNTTLTPTVGVASTGSGTFMGTFDTSTDILSFTLTWTGLTTNLINSHIHLPTTVGGNGPVLVPFFAPGSVETITPAPPALPLGTSGTLSESIHITDPAVLASFETGLAAGLLYVNVHTVQFPVSEIRGDLPARAVVPEPGTLALLGLGLAALAFRRKRA